MLAEQRGGVRSNVFLAATVNWGTQRLAVRIRNMSPSGALIDGDALPEVGAKVRLLRGSLSAVGSVAWAANGQAGLNFDSKLNVRSWTERVGHSGQQRVDSIVGAVRSGRLPAARAIGPADHSLAVLSSALDQICERLASDPAVMVDLGEEMIKLDIIAEALREHARLEP